MFPLPFTIISVAIIILGLFLISIVLFGDKIDGLLTLREKINFEFQREEILTHLSFLLIPYINVFVFTYYLWFAYNWRK